jgi:ABC-type bacteriocin/lantibiotic exporter with double-glycine peptidase domain
MINNPDMGIKDYNYILYNVSYQPPGVCLHEKKLIKLFPFNNDPSNPAMQKLHSVGNTFHELRHAWQQINGLYIEEAEQKLDSENIEDYLKRPSERDAYEFQEQQMNKNHIKISKIIGFDGVGFKYTCDIEATIRRIKMGKKG